MARPSKLNEELIMKFYDEISEGLPICYTCDLLEINTSTYEDWMKKGEEDDNQNVDSMYATFSRTIKKAYAYFIQDSKNRIRQGVQGWQGTAWWLERTNNKFMPKQQIQADDEGKVTVVIGGKQKK